LAIWKVRYWREYGVQIFERPYLGQYFVPCGGAAEHRLAENAVSIRNKYFYKFPSCGNCKLGFQISEFQSRVCFISQVSCRCELKSGVMHVSPDKLTN
ncbi:hypothetical protein THAOC_09424, partial [Thalassiosira oceanica]